MHASAHPKSQFEYAESPNQVVAPVEAVRRIMDADSVRPPRFWYSEACLTAFVRTATPMAEDCGRGFLNEESRYTIKFALRLLTRPEVDSLTD
jgi:hypothetical protein